MDRLSMTHFYKDVAPILYKNGYKPIPIRPNSKVPFLKKGETWQTGITQELVNKWVDSEKGAGGVAITGLCAIDFDITDETAAQHMLRHIKENLYPDCLVRYGFAPKFLIPFSASSAVDHKFKVTWYDHKSNKQEIEFLSPDTQYFVGYGIHPETQQEYIWENGKSLTGVSMLDLPTLDAIDIASIEDAFDAIAMSLNWGRKVKDRSGSHDISGPLLSFENYKKPGRMNSKEGLNELNSWVSKLPLDSCDNRDEWVKIGAAIHHESSGSEEGLKVFDGWSRQSKKYVGVADTRGRWESFGKNNVKPVTGASIIKKLKETHAWVEESRERKKLTDTKSTSTDIVESLNKTHAVINLSGKCKIMNDIESDLTFSSVQDFHMFYKNRTTMDPVNQDKRISFSKLWLSSPKRREYDGIIFEPTLTQAESGSKYNLWKGFAVKPVKGEWELFKSHIYDVIADGNETIAEWVLAWIANIIQHPGGKRPGTSIILRGKQGTGKGIFVNFVGQLFGEHYLQVAHASQVTGRFNSHLKAKLLVFVDEGFWAGDKKAEGVIKNIITEPFITIEPKGMEIIRVANHVSLMIASNNEWVVPAGLEERRFFVLDVSEKYQQNTGYFRKIVQQMESTGLAAMLYDLLQRDISKIDLRSFEQTLGLLEQKIHTMTTLQQYWFERLKDGKLFPEDVTYDTPAWGYITRKKQYDDYLDFADTLKEKFPLTPTQFGMALKKECPLWTTKRRRKGAVLEWGRTFQSLKDCRLSFEKRIKVKIEWDEDDNEVPF